MAGIDESKQFVPLKFAVLTISDSRSLKDDKSGALLVQRIVAAAEIVVTHGFSYRISIAGRRNAKRALKRKIRIALFNNLPRQKLPSKKELPD